MDGSCAPQHASAAVDATARTFTVHTPCFDCGLITLYVTPTAKAPGLALFECADLATPWWCAYECPNCGRRCTRAVSHDGMRRVESIGIWRRSFTLPAELREPRPTGARFAPDDMLDFHELLASTDMLVELVP